MRKLTLGSSAKLKSPREIRAMFSAALKAAILDVVRDSDPEPMTEPQIIDAVARKYGFAPVKVEADRG